MLTNAASPPLLRSGESDVSGGANANVRTKIHFPGFETSSLLTRSMTMAASRRSVATGRSCLECRRRKIKCDRSLPCAYCVRTRIRCAYPPSKASVSTSASGNTMGGDELVDRVSRVEGLFQSLERSIADVAQALPSRAASSSADGSRRGASSEGCSYPVSLWSDALVQDSKTHSLATRAYSNPPRLRWSRLWIWSRCTRPQPRSRSSGRPIWRRLIRL